MMLKNMASARSLIQINLLSNGEITANLRYGPDTGIRSVVVETRTGMIYSPIMKRDHYNLLSAIKCTERPIDGITVHVESEFGAKYTIENDVRIYGLHPPDSDSDETLDDVCICTWQLRIPHGDNRSYIINMNPEDINTDLAELIEYARIAKILTVHTAHTRKDEH